MNAGRFRPSQLLLFVALAAFTAMMLTPVVWALMTSIKQPIDAFAIPPKIVFEPTFEFHRQVWFEKGFGWFLLNSAIIAVSTVVISVSIGTMAAYALSRMSGRAVGGIMLALLSLRMFPHMLLAIPLFILAAEFMNSGSIMDRLLRFCNALVGRWRGGLAHVQRTRRVTAGGRLRGMDLAQVAAQLAQLVAQLGGVLEAQLLGRGPVGERRFRHRAPATCSIACRTQGGHPPSSRAAAPGPGPRTARRRPRPATRRVRRGSRPA